jgi:DNA-binding transcriptional ArsR family regulator
MTNKKFEKKSAMTDGQVEEAARLFGVLAEPARLYLLRALMEGGTTVGGLVEKTGIKQGTVSKHLGILHSAGFLVRRREGANVFYEISDPLVQQLCGLMCQRMREDAVRQLAILGG